MEEVERCPHCGAKMAAYWHKLTPGILSALVKMRGGIARTQVNRINTEKDLVGSAYEMTTWERSNLTKLRFHGLIAKYKEDDKHIAGEWLITKRGFAFLRGEEAIPKSVKTYRNQVVDHDPELIKVGDVLKVVPYFERLQDIEAEPGQRSLL